MIKKLNKPAIQLIVFIIILIAVNYILSYSFFRIDLTSEKRYTLQKQTKTILKNLDEQVYIHIYLDGNLPAGFKQLQKSTSEIIDEFKVYAKNNIQYKFINLSKINKKEKNDIYNELANKGIKPININIKQKEGGISQQVLFPGAIINYSSKELPINLLDNNPGLSGEKNLNNSIEALEFKFISAIKQITKTEKPKIAFIEGNGELDEYEVADITTELNKYYDIDRVKINGYNNILDNYKLIIIAQPTKKYKEKDKYIIDQYLMRGGKIIWFIDAVNTEHDSLSTLGATIAFIQETNLEDQLFKYGVRINPVLVQDLQSAIIPVVGQQGKFVPAPWLYFPLINSKASHPITRNLNMIKTEYISYIDTIDDNQALQKTVLLNTSDYSKIKTAPTQITLSEVTENPDQNQFTKRKLPIAYLLKGQFNSVFKNRNISQHTAKTSEFLNFSKQTEMIVIADGDIIKNKVRQKPNGVMIEPLGYDRYTKQTFGNKDFILNAINYLADDPELIELRSRVVTMRLLDKQKTINSRLKWQIINILIPCLAIIIFGLAFNWNRKRIMNHKL